MNQVLQSVLETVFRFFSKSPKYFKVLQIVIIILGCICGVLTLIQDKTSIVLPDFLLVFTGADSIVALIVAWFVSRLPSDKPEAVKSKVNTVLRK